MATQIHTSTVVNMPAFIVATDFKSSFSLSSLPSNGTNKNEKENRKKNVNGIIDKTKTK